MFDVVVSRGAVVFGGVVPSRLVFGVWSRVTARVCSDDVVPVAVSVDGVFGGFEFKGGGLGFIDPGGCCDVVFYVKALERGVVPTSIRLRVLNPLFDREDVVEASAEFEVLEASPVKPSMEAVHGKRVREATVSHPVLGLPDTGSIYGIVLYGLSRPSVGDRVYRVVWRSVFTHGWSYSGGMKCIKLGCGGWGCSYLCRAGGFEVVLKLPIDYRGFIEEGGEVPSVPVRLLNRIKSMADTLMALDHPGIIRLLGYGVRVPVLVYEYADQGTLAYQLDHGWSPGVEDILVLGLQLADTLRYIHSRGLVHGDVKPSNIFLKDGRAKIGDFSSLTKLLSRTSRYSRLTTCTPGYCAPEQVYRDLKREAIRRGVENRVDVYQLGNVLLELLIGETVDGGEADEADLETILEPLENKVLANLIKEMLDPEPWNRPSMEEVEKTLYRIYKM
ncbi:MAG: hypothetical protein DRN68_08525 [Thaumarchaeota archaeon]|nr:MAG: hypothetical protein DRN68_08525 [Nitrososphaerota archaeon]